MCRWVLAENGIGHSQKQIGEFLAALRESQGGHGDGLFYRGEVYKPVRRKDAARCLKASGQGVALWHTRLASVGQVTNELIHPFAFGDVVLAHNGTDYNLGVVASAYEVITGAHWSDSKVYASLLSQGKKIPKRLEPSSGVWVYSLDKGATWTVKNNGGDCMFCPTLKVWASSLPLSLFPDAYRVQTGEHAIGTIPPKSEGFQLSRRWLGESYETSPLPLSDSTRDARKTGGDDYQGNWENRQEVGKLVVDRGFGFHP